MGLLNGVFGESVEGAAGIYDELQEATLLNSHVAVLPESEGAGSEAPDEEEPVTGSGEGRSNFGGGLVRDEAAEAMPEAEARKDTGPPPKLPAEPADASLLDSTVPLEVENGEALDLSLEHHGGTLEPVAPLVSTRIPGALNEEIEFPNAGIAIEVADLATERSASISGGSVAFYPNVAEDTDLAISPTPNGVETMTQLRSRDSPDVSTYRFSLPPNAELVATDAGGAEVRSGGELLLSIPAPSAIDATGEALPADLEVTDDTMTVTVDIAADASWPVLVDPLFQTYEWAIKNTSGGICSNSFQPLGESSCNNREEWGYDVVTTGSNGQTPLHMQVDNYDQYTPGITVKAHGAQNKGDHGTVIYTVPRYFKETPRPRSFIKSLSLTSATWEAYSPQASPYLFMGIWDATIPGWVQAYQESSQTGHGNKNTAFVYNLADKYTGSTEYDREAKAAEITVNATETTGESLAKVYVGAATVELGDEEVPKAPEPTPQTQWVNQSAPPIAFTAVDYGLGVYAVSASTEAVDTQGNPVKTWKAAGGCIGVGDSACPQTWISSKYNVYIPNAPALNYEPSVLPTGINYLKVVSEDPIGNKSSTSLEEVRVDHIAPTLALTGSITEQEQLGTRRASYTLKANAADGNAEYPQSGIAKAEVKLDGKVVAMEGKQAEEWSPNCTTKSCPLAAEWSLSTAGLAEGKHTVEVIATDAVGLSTTKTLTIETYAATPPSLTLNGSMTEQAALGTSRPRYILKAKSSAMASGFETATLGAPATYASTLGSTSGEGTSHFYEPTDAATDSKGNAWVIDSVTRTANQLQQFNEKGEWLRSTGSSGYGKLKTPWGVAVDASNNVWVADTGNNRVVEFNEKGEFVQTFGTNVNKTKVEASGTETEKNLCTAASGNVCQAATAGGLSGQLKAPKGIALTSGGNIWVADTGNSRIEKFGPAGNMINLLDGNGTTGGLMKEPAAIAVAPDASIWVADTGNNRIEQWNSSLSLVRVVGNKGTGAREFQTPSGIEVDSTGAVWVGDYGNGRVQELDELGTFIQKFNDAAGAAGTPRGLAIDAKGSLWVADQMAFKVYHWTVPGFPVYSSSIGSSGSGNGQFMRLAGLASDGNKGHVWALDQELGRLQQFNEKGEWLRNAGSKGSGAGMLSSPAGITSNNVGNVWVADTGNNRVVEFNEKGEFVETFGTNVNKTKVEANGTAAEKNLCTTASGNVCQAGTAGSASGQLKAPQGIALTSGGNIWVADTGNSRIQKFGPTGILLNNVSGEGSEPGKLKEPAAIAIAPDGSIWVADTGNNRIEQWNSSLALVRTIGKEGSGGAEFKAPAAIFADPSGNIWVGDQKNNRIEEFAEGGKYFGQFGAAGSGKFSFSAPMGIAVDNGGSIWVADIGHSKIQRWSQETPRSEVTTTIWVDGAQKTTLHGTCKTGGCTIEPQWTQESKLLSAGSHSAKVKTTDGLGRSTEGTVSFQITPDTTEPTLEASGELFNAPEGWVEQETYGLNATATDGGSGVTSIAFKIDGQQVASVSQTCLDGGCNETLSKQVSMASYAGGSHPAEIVATDGAGNAFKDQWTINVDPEGHISTKEVEATLEAVEGTSEEAPIAPNAELLEPEQMEFGDNPEFEQAGSKITSTGVPTLTTMSTNPAAGFTITNPYGETTITPVSTETSTTAIVEGVAAVSANTRNQADAIIRPQYNGAQLFQAIRSDSSPETYSWTVHLFEGQTLQSVDATHAQVMYESGKRAFLITAEEAHDATGKEVPTSLEVSGDVLTLKVDFHAGSFVYPILAGAGWETSYTVPVLIQGPENELEIQEKEEAAAVSGGEYGPPHSLAEAELLLSEAEGNNVFDVQPPPSPPSGGGASASSVRTVILEKYERCAEIGCDEWNVWLGGGKEEDHPHALVGSDWAEWVPGTKVVCGESLSHTAEYVGGITIYPQGCGFTDTHKVYRHLGYHLTVYSRHDISVLVNTPYAVFVVHDYLALQSWIWPNGFKFHIHQHYDGGPDIT